MGKSRGAPPGMSLRIVWGGPWNQQSAAARTGKDIVLELLSRGHLIDVLRTEVGRDAKLASLSSAVTAHLWNDVSTPDVLRNADAIIVNVGDDYNLYGGMLNSFSQLGAVAIFHDSLLANLVYAWAIASGPDTEAARFESAFQAVTHTRAILEWFASGAVGAVLHTQQDFDCVREACAGPVAVIPAVAGDRMFVSRYVDRLLPIVASAISVRPVLLAEQTIGRTLGAFGLDAADPAIERIATVFDSLYASQDTVSE